VANDDAAVFELDLDEACEEVFVRFTDLHALRKWMPVTVFEPWVGGRFELEARGMTAVGTVLTLESPHRLAYSWDWRDFPLAAPTTVTITLTPTSSGTRLRLRHSGLSPEQQLGFAQGWDHYLPRLRDLAGGRTPAADTFAGGS
jgi:uncharacterized protein YndB with AHSA1/START domain